MLTVIKVAASLEDGNMEVARARARAPAMLNSRLVAAGYRKLWIDKQTTFWSHLSA